MPEMFHYCLFMGSELAKRLFEKLIVIILPVFTCVTIYLLVGLNMDIVTYIGYLAIGQVCLIVGLGLWSIITNHSGRLIHWLDCD